MGASKSKQVLGKISEDPPPDPIEEWFEQLSREYTSADQRAIAIRILADYTKLVDEIGVKIKHDCKHRGFCPRRVIDDGVERDVSPLDVLQPCQLRTCMKNQLREMLAKFKTWIVTMKWGGSTAGPRDGEVAVTDEALREIIEYLQKVVFRLIESVRSAGVDGTPECTTNNTTGDFIPAIPTGTFKALFDRARPYVVLIAVILVILVMILYMTLPRASEKIEFKSAIDKI